MNGEDGLVTIEIKDPKECSRAMIWLCTLLRTLYATYGDLFDEADIMV